MTVMFCDLVNSTALSARLDPEDLLDLIGAYRAAVAAAVQRFDGFIARYVGDGILVYFGYPQAHEDDAERAVRSGLAAVAAVRDLGTKEGFQLAAHVGIATGLVVVGEEVIAIGLQERDAIGETPNLAARLEALAAPGEVVIADSTRRLVGRIFECQSLGPVELKGLPRPIEAWLVRGELAASSRFESRRLGALTLLVGRQEELELLLCRWEQSKGGNGRVVLVSGEAGIGKSRLAQALQERLLAESHTRITYHCSPFFQDSVLHPVIDQLVRATKLVQADEPRIKLDKLEHLLSQSSDRLVEHLPVFAALLSIPAGHNYPPPSMTPQQLKEHTLCALMDQLEMMCARQPVLIVIEDLHWVDATTLELLAQVVDRAKRWPLLVLATARVEFLPPWPNDQHVSTVVLDRLGRSEVQALVADVAGKALPAEVLNQIVQRTDGVPLFVEELTKSLLESGLLSEGADRYDLIGPLPSRSIPLTLHASLIARLDRLSFAKEIAQIGAVIGREFSYELIAAVTALPETKLRLALAQLEGTGLVFQRGAFPYATFVFKHALVQDAAYANLVRGRRQQLHAQIARVLEAHFPNLAMGELALLAHHYLGAGEYRKAVAGWKLAAERAVALSALAEAANLIRQAVSALTHLGDPVERLQLELDLTLELSGIMRSANGYAAPEAEEQYLRARELCLQLGDADKRFGIEWGLFQCYFVKGDNQATAEIATGLLDHAREHPARPLVDARIAEGMLRYQLGDLKGARKSFETASALTRPEFDEPHQFSHGQNPGIFSASYLARTLWFLGYPDQARTIIDRNVATAKIRTRDRAHLHTYLNALATAIGIYSNRREPAAVKQLSEILVTAARRSHYTYYEALALTDLAWAVAMEGESTKGIAEMELGLHALERTGTVNILPGYYARLAELLGGVGRRQDAMQMLERARNLPGARIWAVEIERIRGELLASTPGQSTVAEAAFEAGLEIARCQHARSLELRIAVSYAHLIRSRGRFQDGRLLLERCLAAFDEGWNTKDLQDARALAVDLTAEEKGPDRLP